MKLVMIYVPMSTRGEAHKIAMELLEKRLIACANMFPAHSFFRFKGEIVTTDEVIMIAKTTDTLYDKVEKEIEQLHSYKQPCILRIDADEAAKGYEKFVTDALKA